MHNKFETFYQEFIYKRTYSRWDWDKNRREDWNETVNRYYDYLKPRVPSKLSHTYEYGRELILQRKVLPSMRALWTAGSALDSDNICAYNCAYTTISYPKVFADILYVLLNGTGMGYSVERQYIAQLPAIPSVLQHIDRVIVVEDSKLGWAESLNQLISLLYEGYIPKYDLSKVRPAGSILKTFGGRSSGPLPLKRLFDYTIKVFESARGRKLNSLECHDLACVIAECVVVGGVRRSSLLSLSNLSDQRMKRAKEGSFWETNPQRMMSNNSTCYTEKPDMKIFMEEWLSLATSGTGERGIFNRDSCNNLLKGGRRDLSYEFGCNPCFTPETLVTIKEKGKYIQKKIIEVQEGDIVLSYNLLKDKQEDKKVLWSGITRNTTKVVKSVFQNIDNPTDILYVTHTKDHPFCCYSYRCGEYKKEYKTLDAYDVVFGIEDRYYKFIGQTQEKKLCDVYDIVVEDNHNFYANNLLVHNCSEIILRPMEFCVSGDTELITKNGIFQIEETENKEVEIWNGKEWSKVIPRRTRKNQELYRVSFSDGSYLDCTKDHKFSVSDRYSKKYTKVETKNLLTFSKYSVHVEPFKIDYSGGKEYKDGYTLGFAIGDGYLREDNVFIDLFGEKIKCKVSGKRRNPYIPKGYNVEKVVCKTNIDSNLFSHIRDDVDGLKVISSWNKESILSFLSGWIDADGTNQGIGIRLYISKFERAKIAQLLFTLCGIKTSLNLFQKKGKETNFGARKEDLYYLQFSDCTGLSCNRVKLENSHNARFKGKWQTVRSVEKLDGVHDVFCFEESKRHMAVFNNVLTYQCNLTSVVVKPEDSLNMLIKKVKVATMLGVLQSTLTDFNFIDPTWKSNCEEERLLGVSMTGTCDHPVLSSVEDNKRLADWLTTLKQTAIDTAAKWSTVLGINMPTAITCCKPEGTSSQLTNTSSGIHTRYSPYYTRRVRVAKMDPIAQFLIDRGFPYNPEIGQNMDNATVYVFDFPIKSPDKAITRFDRTAIQQLEYWKAYQLFYTEHKPSFTCFVSDESWLDVGAWVYRNWDIVSGISFLPENSGIYQLAPYEDITEQQFKEMSAKIPKINFEELTQYESSDYTTGASEFACDSGSCMLS